MSAQIPESSLTTAQLLRIASFDRSTADALDAALGSGSGDTALGVYLYLATGTETGVGFTYTFPTPLADGNYYVGFYGAEGDIIVPATWAFKNKTASGFTAMFAGDGLTVGGLYMFQVIAVDSTIPAVIVENDAKFFTYTALGTEGATFTVALPAARTAGYGVVVTGGNMTNQLTFNTVNHTSTTFDLVCSAPLTAGDVIYFSIGAL